MAGTTKRLLIPAVALAVMGLLPAIGWGVERFPPPDFTTHKFPTIATPPPESIVWECLDLGYLVIGLALATYFGLVRRSRTGLFLLSLVSLAWLGFRRQGCVCPIGAIQNVTLAAIDPQYALPLSYVVFFLLPLVLALFVGRTFCAAVCPLGAIQELVALRPVKVPRWLEQALGLLPWVYLGAAVVFVATGVGFVICRYDPFVGFFRCSAGLNMLIFGGAMLLLGVFVGRPYCRFLCPYGALLGLFSRLSRWHLRIPPANCIECRLCEDVCPYGAIVEPSLAPPVAQRIRARLRLIVALVFVPVLMALGLPIGGGLGVAMSKTHPAVRLAERVRLEQLDPNLAANDASDAFRNTGRAREDLYREAIARTNQFGTAGRWLGLWVGLVIGVKLVSLSLRPRRDEYEPDKANCVSCGRCFWYCPEEQARLGLITDLPLPAETTAK